MKCIAVVGERRLCVHDRLRESFASGQRNGQREIAERGGFSELTRFCQTLMEVHPFKAHSVRTEGVEERRASPAPFIEANAKLERSLGAFNEVELIQAEVRVKFMNIRDAGFSDAYSPYRRGVDER